MSYYVQNELFAFVFCLHYFNALLTDRPWQLLSVCVCSWQRLQAKMGQRSERRWAAVTESDSQRKKCFHYRVKYLNTSIYIIFYIFCYFFHF